MCPQQTPVNVLGCTPTQTMKFFLEKTLLTRMSTARSFYRATGFTTRTPNRSKTFWMRAKSMYLRINQGSTGDKLELTRIRQLDLRINRVIMRMGRGRQLRTMVQRHSLILRDRHLGLVMKWLRPSGHRLFKINKPSSSTTAPNLQFPKSLQQAATLKGQNAKI
jgi:hypothetical protein